MPIDKISKLNIDSEDIVEARLTCDKNVKGSLHLDSYSLNNERKIQLYYNRKYVEGDINRGTIKILNFNGKEKTIKFKLDSISAFPDSEYIILALITYQDEKFYSNVASQSIKIVEKEEKLLSPSVTIALIVFIILLLTFVSYRKYKKKKNIVSKSTNDLS